MSSLSLISSGVFSSPSIIRHFGRMSANAQTTPYNYDPSMTLDGNDNHDVPSSSNLQLSKFSVAAWFKTSKNYASDAYIVNKGGSGSESKGKNMNYGIWMTSSEKIRAGFETSSGSDRVATSSASYNNGNWHYAVATYSGSIVYRWQSGSIYDDKLITG
jgi:hypothetical protein